MSATWSFSANKCLRRCQRQFFYRYIAASHNAKDPLRREAYLLNQLSTPEIWVGKVVHRAIELFVVPSLRTNAAIDWDAMTDSALQIADRQLVFSAAKRYRDVGMTKKSAGDDYAAITVHEAGRVLTQEERASALTNIRKAIANLSTMQELWQEISRRGKYWTELSVPVSFAGASVEAYLDFLCFRGFGKPTIVDWKVSESMGGSDAHLQTAVYAWCMLKSPTWHVENAGDVRLIEVQLLKGDVITHTFDDERLLDVENHIYAGIDEMFALCGEAGYAELSIEDFAYARNSNSCAMCSHQGICSSKSQVRFPARPKQQMATLF